MATGSPPGTTECVAKKRWATSPARMEVKEALVAWRFRVRRIVLTRMVAPFLSAPLPGSAPMLGFADGEARGLRGSGRRTSLDSRKGTPTRAHVVRGYRPVEGGRG